MPSCCDKQYRPLSMDVIFLTGFTLQTENAPYHGESVDEMVTDLRGAYGRALEATTTFEGLAVANVGDAWQGAMSEGVAQTNPYLPPEPGKLDLWGPDHYHPSIYGAYLSALVLVCDIADVSSDTFRPDEQAAHDLGISPADAQRLQRYGTLVLHEDPPPRTDRR